jgi:nucleoside 2-deoxyribosyltransferase
LSLIYIAGPLFTPGERSFLEQIDALCHELGFDTYLPHRDAGLFIRGSESSRYFFENDSKRLVGADVVIAVLNGLEIDSGTAWEMGYTCALHKPVIGYLDDSRIFAPAEQLNPMILNSLHVLVRKIEDLKSELEIYRNESLSQK